MTAVQEKQRCDADSKGAVIGAEGEGDDITGHIGDVSGKGNGFMEPQLHRQPHNLLVESRVLTRDELLQATVHC